MGDETMQLNRDVAFAKWSATIVTQLEHVVVEMNENQQQMKAFTQKLETITNDLAAKTVRMEKIEDLDNRLRVVEKNFWKATGVVSFIAGAIPFIQWVVSLVEAKG